MKLILMGTPQFVVPIFKAAADEHEIVAVFTRAPKPTGRKKILTKSPVHLWADSRGFPVYTNVNDIENQSEIDYIVVAGYGVILRDNVLNFAPCINVHPSDLPKYRGPTPIQTAILNGDTKSAVCIMNVAAAVDAGDVFIRHEFSIGENETTDAVNQKAWGLGAEMLTEYLRAPKTYFPKPQTGTPTFTHKFTSAEEIIDWQKTPLQIHNQVRAIGGRTRINGIDCKVLETKILDEKLEIISIQPSGKNPMHWRDFVNGQHGKINIGE